MVDVVLGSTNILDVSLEPDSDVGEIVQGILFPLVPGNIEISPEVGASWDGLVLTSITIVFDQVAEIDKNRGEKSVRNLGSPESVSGSSNSAWDNNSSEAITD